MCTKASKNEDTPVSERETHFKPASWHTVTPRIVVHEAQELVSFLKRVFEAEGEYETDRPAIIIIGDSRMMISDADIRETNVAFLYVYVADTDDTYQRALANGAISLEEPCNTPYGDRRGMVKDPWGNTWQIATHKPTFA